MRLAPVAAGLALAPALFALPASAQDGGWSGWYVGVGVATTGGRNGDIEASIDPARDNQITYLGTVAGRTFTRERNLDRANVFNLKAGRLMETGRWVWGFEGEIQTGGPDAPFTVAPGSFRRTDVLTQRPYVPLSWGYVDTTDVLKADFELRGEASIRARVGLPVSDRVLVSAFAGPSVVQADLGLRQNSSVFRLLPFTDVLHSRIVFDGGTREFSVASRNSDTLVGAVVGAGVDVQLTGGWRINGEASLARYDAIETVAPAYAGTGSRFSYEPTLYSLSVSLIRRF
ncbi:MAG: outer membrane beta-barrel protein [Caulobacterales bacterium]|nr:outer membrane beta-barrel protein [Caulobacterales bacterium]